MTKQFTDSLSDCARCGKDHIDLTWKRMSRPILDEDGTAWDYWSTCPETGDPVLLSSSRVAERNGVDHADIAFEAQYVAFPTPPYQLWIASNNTGGWYWWSLNGNTDVTITESSETFGTARDAQRAAAVWFREWYGKGIPDGH